jgi:hypothetical protein
MMFSRPRVYLKVKLNCCKAIAQRVNLALLGALEVKIVSGFESEKIVIWEPKIQVRNFFNAHMTA